MGERSGVNLRGEYGPTWTGPGVGPRESVEKEEAKGEGEKDKMEVDEGKEEQAAVSAAEKRRKEKEGADRDRWRRHLWTYVLSSSRYDCLILIPLCSFVTFFWPKEVLK